MLYLSDFAIKKNKENSFNLVGKIKVKILVAVTLIIIGLFFTQLVFANNLAVDGQKLSQIEKENARLDAKNTTLKVQVAKESALNTLSQKAQTMGFTKPAKTVF